MIYFLIILTFLHHNNIKRLAFPIGGLLIEGELMCNLRMASVAVETVTHRWMFGSIAHVRQLLRDLRVSKTDRKHTNTFLIILLVFEVY
jgi:hypothetical protein